MAGRMNGQSRDAIVPGVWAAFYAETSIPAAVRVGETLRLTGHTGETADGVFSTDMETQIRQVFCNIEFTLVEGSELVERHRDQLVSRGPSESGRDALESGGSVPR